MNDLSKLDPDVYDDAADLIETNGRCQNKSRGPAGEMCVSEAIRVARNANGLGHPLGRNENSQQRYMSGLVQHLGIPGVPAEYGVIWNDRPATKDQDVLDALRGTAKDVRRAQDAAS